MYPPALEALRQRMRDAEQAMLSGKGTPGLAHDYGSLCEELGETEAAVATLKKLAAQGADTLPMRELVVASLIGELANQILEVNRSRRTVNELVRAAREAGAPELADEVLR